jgi:hypothetical protein
VESNASTTILGFITFFCTLILASFPWQASSLDLFPLPGEWPCYRRTPGLEARSPLAGHITSPTIAWEMPFSCMESAFLIEPSTQESSLTLPLDPVERMGSIRLESRWGLSPEVVKAGGGTQSCENTTVAAWGEIFPDHPGLEKIEFDSSFAVQGASGKWSPGRGRCLGWIENHWESLWETPPMDGLFQPLPIIGDFDADGETEVAILPWRELIILNAQSGNVKSRCQFTEGRSYGFFGVSDLDSDGVLEFVVVADFAKHIDLLGYREGQVRLLWQQNIELDISNPRKILRVSPKPVGRFSRKEPRSIVTSQFDNEADQRWHVMVYQGLTGKILADLTDHYLQGIMDLDGDGLDEILTTVTRGSGIPEYGPIEIWNLIDDQPHLLWRSEDLGWQTWEPPTSSWVNTAATFGRKQALVRKFGGKTFAVLKKIVSPGETEIQVSTWTDSGFKAQLSVRGPELSGISVDPQGILLVASTPPPGVTPEIQTVDASIHLLETKRSQVSPATVAVVKNSANNKSTLVVQSGEILLLYETHGNGGPPQLSKSISGHGQSVQWPQTKGPVFADLRGDGKRQLLYATAAPTGCARMVAYCLDGTDLWFHDFPEIPGGLPVWNSGGLILWQSGFFTSRDHQDVLVTVRRSMMHSEETLLLSGRDGSEVWRRNRQISNRGVGGTSFAISDFDKDGLDDCASMHPSLLYILKGSNGSDLLAMDATWESIEAKPVYFASPVVTGIGKEGIPPLFFQTSQRVITGMTQANGTLSWIDGAGVSPDRTDPTIGDFDGDGQTEIISAGFTDGTRCYEAVTGKVKWTLPFGENQTVTGSLSADLDSDGKDEAVFVVGSKLVCLSNEPNGPGGKIRWELQFPCDLGPPSYADLGGKKGATLLMAGSNGILYAVR